MNPQKGQQIKCVLRNNLIIDGIVESWTDNKSVLRAKDGSSVSVIQHTDQDVVIVKILLKELTQMKQDLEDQFEQELEKPSEDELRLKNLADLKSMMIEQEKKIVANKLREHHVEGVKKVTYGQPGFLQMPRSK
jgi:hypothetical protein